MNTKIKVLISSCFLLFIIENIFSQEVKSNRCSIDSILEYKVINPEICKAIDTVLFYTKDCIYYSVLNKPFLIWIWIYDTSRFSVSSIPYSCTLINFFGGIPETVKAGFSNYKGHVVLIQSFLPNYVDYFFKSTDRKSNFYYENSENILDHIFSASEHVEIFFDYKNGKLVMDEYDISLCRNNYSFHYMVQQGDTWQDIADKCGCPIKDLTKGYKDANPIPGYLLIVNYLFEGGKLVGIDRIQ